MWDWARWSSNASVSCWARREHANHDAGGRALPPALLFARKSCAASSSVAPAMVERGLQVAEGVDGLERQPQLDDRLRHLGPDADQHDHRPE
jgi:hypothetical protein